MLQGTENRKHRAMLMLAYGLGEVLALTPQDIDSKRMALYVRGGKGKKDRDLPLPESLLLLLRERVELAVRRARGLSHDPTRLLAVSALTGSKSVAESR